MKLSLVLICLTPEITVGPYVERQYIENQYSGNQYIGNQYVEPTCNLPWSVSSAYAVYAARVKPGLVATCDLFDKAKEAAKSGLIPELDDGLSAYVCRKDAVSGCIMISTLLNYVLSEMPTEGFDKSIKSYGCGYHLEDGEIIVGCIFS
ncbi:hypothetical protein Q1695_008058 [Nippostrongylus brasiliensis]|nr:hypothetical protein Q1695_008058 [Nippostrongylus brasiliensis]